MKNTPLILLLLSAFFALHAEQFRLNTCHFFCLEKDHQKVTPIDNYRGSQGTLVQWSNNKNNRMFFEFAPTHTLADDFKQLNITFTVVLPPNCPIKKLTARFRDEKSEGFIFPVALTDTSAGEHKVEWVIKEEDIAPASIGCKNKQMATKSMQFPVRFLGIGVETHPDPATGEFLIKDIDITPKFDTSSLKNLAKVTMDFAEENPVIRTTRDTRPIALHIMNKSYTALDFQAEIAVFDVNQTCIFTDKRPLSLPIAEEDIIQLPTPKKCGVYTIDALLKDKEGNAVKLNTAFAVMNPTGQSKRTPGEFLFCVQSQLDRLPVKDKERGVYLCSLIGANGLRHGTNWMQSEPQKGKMDFSAYENVVLLARRYDMTLESSLAYTPNWAADPAWKGFAPKTHPNLNGRPGMPFPKPEYYERYVRQILKRYGDKVPYFEVWNEPELPHFANFPPEDYVKLLKITYDQRNRFAPHVKILNGGFSGAGPTPFYSKPDYVEDVLRLGHPYFDIVAFHAHGPFEGYVRQVTAFKSLLNKYGIKKPWWSNETAISAITVGQYKQAETLIKKVCYSMAEGAIGYTWHNLRNNGKDVTDSENHYGLLNNDFTPRMAYLAYNTVCGLLTNAKYAGTCLPGHPLYAYQFKTPTHNVAVVWHSPDTLTGLYWCNTQDAEVVDMFGNAEKLPVFDNAGWLPTSGTPVFIRDAKAMPTLLAPVISTESPLPAAGTQGKIALAFANPTKRPLPLEIRLSGINLKPLQDSLVVTVPPGGITKEITVSAPTTNNGQASLKLLVTRKGLKQKMPLILPIRGAFSVNMNKPVDKQPTFAINKRENVRILVPNAPSTSHLIWKNADDLSATFQWGADNTSLLFKAIVKDDIHCNPHTGSTIWQGDSIQLMLTMPGQKSDWEFGFAKTANGNEKQCYSAVGTATDKAIQNVKIDISRDEKSHTTTYTGAIPWKALGLASAPASIRFNVIFNDNDHNSRETMGSFTSEPKASDQYLQLKIQK